MKLLGSHNNSIILLIKNSETIVVNIVFNVIY